MTTSVVHKSPLPRQDACCTLSGTSLSVKRKACDEKEKNDLPFDICGYISCGAFGSVYLCRRSEQPEDGVMAMKIVRKMDIIYKNMLNNVYGERDILSSVNCPFVMSLNNFCQTDNYLYFVMEFMVGGDLKNMIRTLRSFNEYMAAFYISECALALDYLHKRGIIHRDIKPDNMLISKYGHLKLTDFGLSETTDFVRLNVAKEVLTPRGHRTIARTPRLLRSLSSRINFNNMSEEDTREEHRIFHRACSQTLEASYQAAERHRVPCRNYEGEPSQSDCASNQNVSFDDNSTLTDSQATVKPTVFDLGDGTCCGITAIAADEREIFSASSLAERTLTCLASSPSFDECTTGREEVRWAKSGRKCVQSTLRARQLNKINSSICLSSECKENFGPVCTRLRRRTTLNAEQSGLKPCLTELTQFVNDQRTKSRFSRQVSMSGNISAVGLDVKSGSESRPMDSLDRIVLPSQSGERNATPKSGRLDTMSSLQELWAEDKKDNLFDSCKFQLGGTLFMPFEIEGSRYPCSRRAVHVTARRAQYAFRNTHSLSVPATDSGSSSPKCPAGSFNCQETKMLKVNDWTFFAQGFTRRSTSLLAGMANHSMSNPCGTILQEYEDERRLTRPAMRGTPDYLAPELISSNLSSRRTQTRAVDWWALGCCLFEFIYGCPPFWDKTVDEIFCNILNHRIEYDNENIPEHVNFAIQRLLSWCPQQRAELTHLRQMTMFKCIDFDRIQEMQPPYVPNNLTEDDLSNFKLVNSFRRRRRYSRESTRDTIKLEQGEAKRKRSRRF